MQLVWDVSDKNGSQYSAICSSLRSYLQTHSFSSSVCDLHDEEIFCGTSSLCRHLHITQWHQKGRLCLSKHYKPLVMQKLELGDLSYAQSSGFTLLINIISHFSFLFSHTFLYRISPHLTCKKTTVLTQVHNLNSLGFLVSSV